MDERFPELIDYRRYRNANQGLTREFDLFHYLGMVSTPDLIVAVKELLFPATLEHDQRLFLKRDFSVDRYESLVAQFGTVYAQSILNSLPISYILPSDLEGYPNSAYELIANTVAECWRIVLHAPELKVEVFTDDAGVCVTFYQGGAFQSADIGQR